MQPNTLYQTLSVGTRCLALVLCLWLPCLAVAVSQVPIICRWPT
jgi:hypothetical protein